MMQRQIYLRRQQASEYCASHGLPVAVATLAKLACVGGGPEFRSFGRIPLYTPETLDAWIASKLSKPRSSTSQTKEASLGG